MNRNGEANRASYQKNKGYGLQGPCSAAVNVCLRTEREIKEHARRMCKECGAQCM